MQNRVRKQPKWHELHSSVPSIPRKDKQVPEGDDYDQDAKLQQKYITTQ